MTKQGNNVHYMKQSKVPVGSTSRESLIASEVAISWLAGDIANMMQLGCWT